MGSFGMLNSANDSDAAPNTTTHRHVTTTAAVCALPLNTAGITCAGTAAIVT